MSELVDFRSDHVRTLLHVYSNKHFKLTILKTKV